ncbi:hypothetical protein Emag_005215 [Eimeria magna]
MRLNGAFFRAACTASIFVFFAFESLCLANLEEQRDGLNPFSVSILPDTEPSEYLAGSDILQTSTVTTAATATTAATQTEASIQPLTASSFDPEDSVFLDERQEKAPDAAAASTAAFPRRAKGKRLLVGFALSMLGAMIAGYYIRAYEATPAAVVEALERHGYLISSRASKEEARLAGRPDGDSSSSSSSSNRAHSRR